MTRMKTIVRIAVGCSLVALLGACASMYGKGQDPGSNRLGAIAPIDADRAVPDVR